MSEIQIPEDFEELDKWIKDAENRQVEAVTKMPELASALEEQRRMEEEVRKKLNEIQRAKAAIMEQQTQIRVRARQEQTALQVAKRRYTTFASEIAIKKRLEEEAHRFDEATVNHVWRDSARDYQLDGARRLASARRGILGDKRGLGKTLTSLIWADMLGAKRILVFAPKDVLRNFKREVEHWSPDRHVGVLGGMNKIMRDMFLGVLASQDQFLLLCNYEAWRRDPELLENLKNLRADTVIIDEAHNIKNKTTTSWRGIRDIVYADNHCPNCGHGDIQRYKQPLTGIIEIRCGSCLKDPEGFGYFCSVKNVLPMTGTAILNRPQDLWPLLYLIDKLLFPSEDAFLQDYCETDLYTGRWRFKSGGEEALIKKLGHRFIRRDKKSVGGFKEQIHVPHYIEFDKALYPDQWKVIKQIQEFGAIKMAENVRLDVVGILPELTRRRQAIVWPAGIKIWEYDDEGRKTGRVLYEAPATESIKMDKMMEIAKEIIFEDEDRLVVFSQFKEALKEAERRFKELGVTAVRYDGDISDYMANVAQLDFDGKTAPNHPKGTGCNSECVNWNKNGYTYCTGYKFQVILAHYKKGGVGLNLNAARQMIKLDREWNPGKEDQADGRIDRMDNTMDSIVHTIHVEGSVDNFMDALIDEKAAMIEGFETSHDLAQKMFDALMDKDMV